MANSLTTDLFDVMQQVNRQAFSQPVMDGWLRSVLELLRERFPLVTGVQVVQPIGNMAMIQASSGQVPQPAAENRIALDDGSPVNAALSSGERQIAVDLRVYPIVYGGEVVGALIIYTANLPEALDEAFSILAVQLGPALLQHSTAGLVTPTSATGPLRRQLRLMRSLYEVTRVTSSELNITEALQRAAQSMVETLSVEYSTIQIYDIARNSVVIAADYPSRGAQGTILPARNPITSQFIDDPLTGPIVITDTQDPNADLDVMAEVIKRVQARSLIFVPMRAGGTLIGSITAITVTTVHVFTPEEIENVQAIAGQLAISIRNAQLFAELERRAAQLEQITELGRHLTSTLDQTAIFHIAASSLKTLLTFDRLSIALRSADENALLLYLIDGEQALPVVMLPFAQTALRTVFESAQQLTIDDISRSDYPDYRLLARHAPPDGWESGPLLHSALIVPLLINGRVIGTLNLTRETSGAYTAADIDLTTQIAAQFAIALENARLFSAANERIRTEALRNQLSVALNMADMATLVLETTQNIGQAVGARRARVRFNPPEDKA